MARFQGFLNSNLARKAGRLHLWQDKLWARTSFRRLVELAPSGLHVIKRANDLEPSLIFQLFQLRALFPDVVHCHFDVLLRHKTYKFAIRGGLISLIVHLSVTFPVKRYDALLVGLDTIRSEIRPDRR